MSHRQRGMTTIEALVVVLIVATVVAASGLSGLGWLRAERQRGAAYEIFVQMSRARVEAAHRNRPCRLLLDTAARTVQVVDLNDPANVADDEQVSLLTLEQGVEFGRPDVGAAVTLDSVAGSQYEARFAQDGTLISSPGMIGLRSGDRYYRISVYAAGGIAIERWDGASSWVDA